MGPQRRLGIYVGYESSSIIKYLEPSTGDLFTARFVDCHFDESFFPTIRGENKPLENKISWNESSLSHLDPRTKQCELKVQRIIDLQSLANQLPNEFTDPKRVTKSYVPAANTPIKVDVPIGQSSVANETETRLKRGRLIGSKDKIPQKRKGSKNTDGRTENEETPEESIDIIIPKVNQVPESCENEEISINYVTNEIRWKRNEINIDDNFAFNAAINVINDKEDHDPKSINECRQRDD
jgi:hypothetical protein